MKKHVSPYQALDWPCVALAAIAVVVFAVPWRRLALLGAGLLLVWFLVAILIALLVGLGVLVRA